MAATPIIPNLHTYNCSLFGNIDFAVDRSGNYGMFTHVDTFHRSQGIQTKNNSRPTTPELD